MLTLIKWFAGFFEDKAGSASSKRAAMYICLGYLYLIVDGSMHGKAVDDMVLFTVAGIIVAGLGLSTAEFFSSYKKQSDKPTP